MLKQVDNKVYRKKNREKNHANHAKYKYFHVRFQYVFNKKIEDIYK